MRLTESASSSLVATQVKQALIITLGDDMSGGVFSELHGGALERVRQVNCRYVLLELSALKFLDATEFQQILSLRDMISVLGAEIVIVGLRPSIIAYLMCADVDVNGLRAFLDLDSALSGLGIVT